MGRKAIFDIPPEITAAARTGEVGPDVDPAMVEYAAWSVAHSIAQCAVWSLFLIWIF